MIFGMKIGAVFNYKLKRGLAGRRQSCENVQKKIAPSDKVIWMHAASLGEYEQGLPVLEKLKENFPQHKILVTFFSPSGYENVIKRKRIADAVAYLPFDRKVWIDEFTSKFKTDIFFNVKYDFWYNLLKHLKEQGAKSYVVSAHFYETQIYFKPHGKWFVKQLKENISWIFHQTKHSSALAKEMGLVHSSTTGDTRFDRVRQKLNSNNTVKHIAEFKDGKTLIVFGSSWESEERLAEMIANKNKNVKIVIAPHDLKRVPHLKTLFPKSILYSEIAEQEEPFLQSQILIIDSIGLLSKLYSYADISIVGGGFHTAGLHNILEAAVFGSPVFFGNRYRKNPEADALILSKGGKSFEDEFFASKYILNILANPDVLQIMGEKAQNFVLSQPDATALIVKKILADQKSN